MDIRFIEDIGELEPAAWDALAGDDDPFVEHAFLAALEQSGTVGGASGWEPLHVTVWDEGRLVGALPLYAKDHSFGEFIFDWGWADAAERLGIPYYPKLVSMVPVTPATGRRLLVAADVDRGAVVAEIVRGAFEAVDRMGASSLHLLFVGAGEGDELVRADARLMPRLTHQFHWHNEGYRSFDDYLARFRSAMRKQVKKERRRVVEAGLDVRVLSGEALTTEHLHALYDFYRDTCMRHGSYPYLSRAFFDLVAARLAHRAVAVMAFRDETAVGGLLNFEKGRHLYGRYWGASEDHDSLHFELCYYRLIERAIERGMTRFEAGAQGHHKLRRGLEPSPIHSVHFIRHPVLGAAVASFLPREAAATQEHMAELAVHGPFRRGPT